MKMQKEKTMKKLFLIIAMLFVLPVQSVFAAMKPADTITLDISNIPDDAVYIDVLFDFKDGENYTELDKDYVKRCGFDTAELAGYDEDGFVSFSCHYRGGNKADMHIKEGKTVFVGEEEFRRFKLNDNSLKLAVLDKDGHILQVSDPVKTDDPEKSIYLVGDIKYNVAEDRIQPDLFDNNYGGTTVNEPIYYCVIAVLGGLILLLIVLRIRNSMKPAEKENKEYKASDMVFSIASAAAIVSGIGMLLFLIFPTNIAMLFSAAPVLCIVGLAVITAMLAAISFAFRKSKPEQTDTDGEAAKSNAPVIILSVILAAALILIFIIFRFMFFG